MRVLCIIGIAISATCPPLNAADKAPAAKLPADGAWVRYHVQDFDYNGRETIRGTTIKLVGTQMEKGEVCRWLEFERSVSGSPESKDVVKFLIRETDLLKRHNPILRTLRAWYKTPDGAQDILKIVTHIESLDRTFGPPLVFLPGSASRAKPVAKKKSVDYQGGRFEIAKGLSGVHKSSYRSIFSPTVITNDTSYTYWPHAKIPFGFTAATMKLTHFQSDDKTRYTRSAKYTVEAWGTDAKTGLPKHN